jgi:hypothetical protein
MKPKERIGKIRIVIYLYGNGKEDGPTLCLLSASYYGSNFFLFPNLILKKSILKATEGPVF